MLNFYLFLFILKSKFEPLQESCCAVPMLIPDDIAEKCDQLVYNETGNALHDELVR